MQDKIRERWQELCEQVAVEQDHDKLMALITEIERLLVEMEQRLGSQSEPPNAINAANAGSAD